MNIPLEVLEMREEFKARGDNKIIAERASNGRKNYNSQNVADAVRRGRADAKVVVAMSRFYKSKRRSVELA